MEDVKFTIFKLLTLQDAYHYALTCQDHYNIFMKDHLWKHYLESRIMEIIIEKTWNTNYRLTHKRICAIQKVSVQFKLIMYSDMVFELTTIDRYQKQISVVPSAIGELINLQQLILSHNKITNVSKEIGNLSNLRKLFLDYNLITSIPREIGNLIKLEELNVGNNPITIFPDELCNLINLKRLYLTPDQLTNIPNQLIIHCFNDKF